MSDHGKIAEWIHDAVIQQPTPTMQLLAIIARQQLETNERLARLERIANTQTQGAGAVESQNQPRAGHVPSGRSSSPSASFSPNLKGRRP